MGATGEGNGMLGQRRSPVPLSPLVRVALVDMSRYCNKAKGFLLPPERNGAVFTLRALHLTAREPFDPRGVENWAAGEGWSAKYARDLGVIAERVIQGKNFLSAHRGIRRDPEEEREAVERWRRQLDGDG